MLLQLGSTSTRGALAVGQAEWGCREGMGGSSTKVLHHTHLCGLLLADCFCLSCWLLRQACEHSTERGMTCCTLDRRWEENPHLFMVCCRWTVYVTVWGIKSPSWCLWILWVVMNLILNDFFPYTFYCIRFRSVISATPWLWQFSPSWIF